MTKTSKYTLALLAALALLLSACGKTDQPTSPTQPTIAATEPTAVTTSPTEAPTEPPTQPVDIELEFSRADDVYTLDGADGAELIRVSVARPVIESMPGVNAYYADWANDLEYNISLSLDDVQRQYDELKDIRRDYFPYRYDADFEVRRSDGVLFSALRTIAMETGGAHGSIDYMAENFITQTGALLTMDDLFAVPQSEYNARIQQAVLKKIDERYGSMGAGTLYDGFENTMMDKYDPKHFCVTQTGVIFFWNNYILGPHVAGEQIYEIPFETLADIMNPVWIR